MKGLFTPGTTFKVGEDDHLRRIAIGASFHEGWIATEVLQDEVWIPGKISYATLSNLVKKNKVHFIHW